MAFHSACIVFTAAHFYLWLLLSGETVAHEMLFVTGVTCECFSTRFSTGEGGGCFGCGWGFGGKKGGGLPLASAKANEAVTAAAGSLASGEISPGSRALRSAGPHHSSACRCN